MGKAKGVLAGVPFFNAVFEELGCRYVILYKIYIINLPFSVEWKLKDGEEFDPISAGAFKPVVLARVTGPSRKVLLGERTALNVLARACGIGMQCCTY